MLIYPLGEGMHKRKPSISGDFVVVAYISNEMTLAEPKDSYQSATNVLLDFS